VKKASFILALLSLLAPLVVRAQMPMLLDRSKPLLIGTPRNSNYVSYVGDVAYFYGDSVTVGYNPTSGQPNLTNRFAALLCTNLSMTEVNDGVGASQLSDIESDDITTNVFISNSTVSVWLAGYNDVFWYGSDSDALGMNQETVESMAAWLAIPTSIRVSESDRGVSQPNNNIFYFPAGWNTNEVLGDMAFSSQTIGASFYFSGSTLLIGTVNLAGSGNAIVTVGDYSNSMVLPPYVTNVYSCNRTAAATGPGPYPSPAWANRTYSPGLIVITNLTSNRHYAFFTPQTTATTWIGWYAAYSTNQLPLVVLAGTLQPANADYADFHPTYLGAPADFTKGSVTAANQYSLMLSNAAVTLSSLGLNVKWVPAPTLNASTDYFSDGIHPNASGHQKLASAIKAAFGNIAVGPASIALMSSENPSAFGDSVAFTGTLPSNATGTIVFIVDGRPVATNALSSGQAAYTTSALAIGSHTIAAAYSGDVNYSASTNSLVQTVNSVLITWPTPAAIAYGAVLTTNQLDATSSVAGTFVYTPSAGTAPNAGTNLLTAVFTPTDMVHYSGATNTVYLVVQPAVLTVTANNAARGFGQNNPAFSGVITGLQNGDNITATYATTATTSSASGSYPIVPTLVDPNGRLGNYTVTIINGTLTVTAVITPTVCYFYGDSVTVGFNPNDGQPNLTNRFAAVLCTNLLMTEVNEGVGGSQMSDAESDAITSNDSISNSTASVWLAGYNDVFWYGSDPAAEAINTETVESMAAWLAIPTSVRVSETDQANYGPNSDSFYFPQGDWNFNATLGDMAFSSVPSQASFYFSGTTLLIGTVNLAGCGNAVVTVGDYSNSMVLPPYATNVYSCNRTAGITGPGPSPSPGWANRAYSPGLIIITNLTSNRHYAFFAPQTAATIWIGWYAAYSTNQLPKVVLAGTLKPENSDYTDFHPVYPGAPSDYTLGSAAAADQYSLMLSNAAVLLSSLGLNVSWVPVPILDPGTNYFSDGIHPNSSGHLKLANAIQAAFGSVASGPAPIALMSSENPSTFGDSVAFTGTLPSNATGTIVFSVDGTPVATNALSSGQAAYTTSALAIGSHTIAAAYSGNANYSASTNSLLQLVNSALITWAVPAAITYGAVLTTNQLNATSSVAGTFVYTPPAGTAPNAGTNLLTVVFTPTDMVHYSSATNKVSLVVQPAALTVTAGSATRGVGQTNPVFSGTITGIQNGDNITATYATTATTSSPAGSYPIVPTLVDPNGRLANYTVTINNGTLTVNAAAAPPVCYFYGDSVTVGFNPNAGQPNLTNRFSALLCTNLLMTEANEGVSGSQMSDAESDAITSNGAISNSTASVWLAGYNDVFWYGSDPAAEAINTETVESMAAWLAIPTSMRVSETNTANYSMTNDSFYYFPGWNQTATLGGLALSGQAEPASFYFSGTTLVIGTAQLAGSGSVTVTVGDCDPANQTLGSIYSTTVYSCNRTAGATGPGPYPSPAWANRLYSPGLIIITNLTSNRHYAYFTPQSSATTWLGWYAGLSTNLLPKVILAGTFKPANSDYADFHPTYQGAPADYTLGSAAAADQYSLILSNAAVTLSAIGLNVKWVPVPILDASTNYFSDGIHPNASGHQKLANAIQAAF
jgi:lysophospholipase L1-like esterase